MLEKKRREGKTPKTIAKLAWLLGLALPYIGKRPIAELKAPEILVVLRRVEARRKHETATRLREIISGVFRFAVAWPARYQISYRNTTGATTVAIERLPRTEAPATTARAP